MFLVLFSCGMDDFPVLITNDRAKALVFIGSLENEVPESVQRVFGMDASHSICIKLIEFGGVDDCGFHPTKCDVVRDFDREAAAT